MSRSSGHDINTKNGLLTPSQHQTTEPAVQNHGALQIPGNSSNAVASSTNHRSPTPDQLAAGLLDALIGAPLVASKTSAQMTTTPSETRTVTRAEPVKEDRNVQHQVDTICWVTVWNHSRQRTGITGGDGSEVRPELEDSAKAALDAPTKQD